jgi:hypothetical protein
VDDRHFIFLHLPVGLVINVVDYRFTLHMQIPRKKHCMSVNAFAKRLWVRPSEILSFGQHSSQQSSSRSLRRWMDSLTPLQRKRFNVFPAKHFRHCQLYSCIHETHQYPALNRLSPQTKLSSQNSLLYTRFHYDHLWKTHHHNWNHYCILGLQKLPPRKRKHRNKQASLIAELRGKFKQATVKIQGIVPWNYKRSIHTS